MPDQLSISSFIQKIKSDGLARTNRFAVEFGFPAVLGNGANPYKADPYTAALLCENIQLPGINLNTIQNRTYGELRETPYETMYDNITATFYVDREMKIKHLFDSWLLSIQGYDTGSRSFKYYNDYTTDMKIFVKDTANNTYYGVTMYEVYPKTIAAVSLDNNSKEIMKVQITFQYKYWTPSTFTQRTEENSIGDPSSPTPWREEWNDVNEWLGNPLPGFNTQNIKNWDVGKLLKF